MFPCVQHPCGVYNVHVVCTMSMWCVQCPCGVYNVHALIEENITELPKG